MRKIEFAISQLSKTLKKDYQIEHLNTIIGWVNDQQNININENHLYAKLFIHKLIDLKLSDEDYSVNKFNSRAMSDILMRPLSEYYEELTETLNMNFTMEVFKENGISSEHRLLKSDEELKNESVAIKNMSDEDILKIKNGIWEIEDVKERVNGMLSQALNKYQ